MYLSSLEGFIVLVTQILIGLCSGEMRSCSFRLDCSLGQALQLESLRQQVRSICEPLPESPPQEWKRANLSGFILSTDAKVMDSHVSGCEYNRFPDVDAEVVCWDRL